MLSTWTKTAAIYPIPMPLDDILLERSSCEESDLDAMALVAGFLSYPAECSWGAVSGDKSSRAMDVEPLAAWPRAGG